MKKKKLHSEYSYNLYPTVLDSYIRYLNSGEFKDEAEARKELIDKINRVAWEENDLVTRGKKLQLVIDDLLERNIFAPKNGYTDDMRFEVHDILVPFKLLRELAEPFIGSVRDWRTEGDMQTKYGLVHLYGHIDYLNANVCFDLKYLKEYELGKYKKSIQKLLYPYCLKQEGVQVDYFEFRATDLTNIFPESYRYEHERDSQILRGVVESFIEFLEDNRKDIFDKKIFALPEAMEELPY